MREPPAGMSSGVSTTARRGFDAVKEGGQVLMRTLASGMEKDEGKRAPCHGCKGSGQLCHKGQTAPLERAPPCWFCLGIGILPVTDLQGFLIAHNPPLFRSTDEQYYKAPPIRIRLYLAKYPGARCKLTSSRLPKEVKKAMFATIAPVSPLRPGTVDPTTDLALKSRLPKLLAVEQHSFRRGGSPYAGESVSLRTQDLPAEPASPSRQRSPSSPVNELFDESIEAESRASRSRRKSSPADGSPRGKSGSPQSSGRRDEDASSPLQDGSRRQATRSGSSVQTQPVSPSGRKGNSEAGGSSGDNQPRSPSTGSPRPRSPRRDRNRIREKAEREAVERTRHLQRPSSPRSSLPAENGGSPGLDSSRALSGGRWESESWTDGKAGKNGGVGNIFTSLFGAR